MLAHLDLDYNVGSANVYLESGHLGENDSTDRVRDFGRAEREGLVRALCLDLEGLKTCQELRNIKSGYFRNALHILFGDRTARDRRNAEHLGRRLEHSVDVAVVRERLDVYRALRGGNAEASESLGAEAKLLAKLIFKKSAVCALEHDLAVFTKQNFLDLFHLNL